MVQLYFVSHLSSLLHMDRHSMLEKPRVTNHGEKPLKTYKIFENILWILMRILQDLHLFPFINVRVT